LGGVHASTYWSAELTGETTISASIEVEQALAQQLDHLTPVMEMFADIRSEGGKAELFVGLFSEDNIVVDLEPALMARLAQHSLGICLDYYSWKR